MIALDFRKFDKKLTLSKMVEVYDEFKEMMTPIPMKLGVKQRIVYEPDEIWVTQWQHDNLMSSTHPNMPNWETWRGIQIKVV